MPAPTFDFDLFGSGDTLHARKDNFNQHLNTALQALWNDLRQNMTNSFVTRDQAVAAGQEALAPGIGPILVRNGDFVELRGPGQTEDQLFDTHPTWGVLLRLESGSWSDVVDVVAMNAGKIFGNRQQAVDFGQEDLPARTGILMVRDGNYIQLRGPGQTNDQLFDSFPNWGILTVIPDNVVFTSVVSQAGIIHLVNQTATAVEGGTRINADIAPASLTAGLTVGAGTKAMVTLPTAIEGNLSLQVAGDSARNIRNEQNTAIATADDVEPGATLIVRQFGGVWVIQSGAVGSATVAELRDSIGLVGEPIDGFEGANTGGYLTAGNGQIASASESWSFTDFIPVSPGQVISYVGGINLAQGAGIAYYDADQNYLEDGLLPDPDGSGPIQNVSARVTIPDGVSFIRAATLNTGPHGLTYLRLGTAAQAPVDFANEMINAMEEVSGAERVRMQNALNSLLGGSAMPTRTDDMPGMGDSFTVGANASSPANRFLNRVAAALGASVYNYGIGGTVLQNSNGSGGTPLNNNGRDRFRSVFINNRRDFALIAYGFNDARYTAAPSTFNAAAYQSDFREVMVGMLCDGYTRNNVLIVGPHYITDIGLETGTAGFTGQTRAGFEEFVTAAAEVAEEFGVLYFDSYAYMRDNGGDALISDDDIHPNDAGHEAIANGILETTSVLNLQPAPAIIGWAATENGAEVRWSAVAGATGYQAVAVPYDSLTIGTPVAGSAGAHEFTGLASGTHVAMVRAVFAGGAGPWAVSKPLTI